MPELGEIKRGREIGRGNEWNKYIWSACEQCGKARWVQVRGGIAKDILCRKCGAQKRSQPLRGQENPNWKGGKTQARGGYIYIYLAPDDFFSSMATGQNYVLEHRLVMAKHLGRCLQRWEIVHHRHTRYPAGSVEDKRDNRIANLQLVSDDRHRQITILENRIKLLEQRVFLLEAENILLKAGVS